MKRQKGHSLIELLISITVFTLGLLVLLDFDCQNFRQENNTLLKAYGINQLKEAEIFILSPKKNPGLRTEESRWNMHNQQCLPQGIGKLKSTAKGGNIVLSWFPLPSSTVEEKKTELQLTVVKGYDDGE